MSNLLSHDPEHAPTRLTQPELEILKLIVRGDSVIDWRRLFFSQREEVDAFLRLNLFDPADPADQKRLEAILAQAVDYLRKVLRYRVAAPVAHPKAIQDLFLYASGVLEPERRLRKIACVVLKVMHTVHHIDARELLFMARISEAELSQMVDSRVREVLDRLAAGQPIASYEGSAKSRQSVITKLIAKRENLAAQVFDRHRYRIVVRDREALVSTVLALASELFPFNYVLPGQTENTLLSLSEIVAHASTTRDAAKLLEGGDSPQLQEHNEFSGHSYRILNFIVDLPLRIDATVMATRRKGDSDFGRIVFAPVEMQVVDEATARSNEAGDNAHARYKRRQLRRVLARLSRGLVVPRGVLPRGRTGLEN